jgi:ATP-binding cassette subfamily F protein 3
MQAQGLSKSIGITEIFAELSFILHQGEKVGLVGLNGAGKTTLLKILAGADRADRGGITRAQGMNIGYLAQHFVPDFQGTVWELMLEEFAELREIKAGITTLEGEMARPEVYQHEALLKRTMDRYSTLTHKYEESGGYSYERKVRGILAGLGFPREDYGKNVQEFSGGQKTRLALGKLLLTEPELLLLDEPTNHLDIMTVEWLEDFLQDYPGAVLMVSHDRYFLDRTVTRIFDLEAGRLREYGGNFSRFQLLKAQLLAAQQKELAKQQVKIARLEAYIERNRAGIKSKQARGRQSLLNRMERVEAPVNVDRDMDWLLAPKKTGGQVVLAAHNLDIGYAPEAKVVSGVNLNLQRGEKIGLVGANGTGKSTLLRTLAGRLPKLAGEITLGSQITVGYFAQELQDDLYQEANLIQAVQEIEPMSEDKARSFLAKFLFTGDEVYKRVGNLSGGERARLVLARLFLQGDNFLVMDEPTNHLDIAAKDVLEEGLSRFSGTTLVVSHDRYFLDQTVSRILELDQGVLREFPGDYTYYRWKKQQLELEAREEAKAKESSQIEAKAREGTPTAAKTSPQSGTSSPKGQRTSGPKQAKLPKPEEIEAQIATAEERLAELSQLMSLPETYRREDGGKEYLDQYRELQESLESLYSLWESTL